MIWERWSGAGNTFYIADEWSQSWDSAKAIRQRQALQICGAFPEAATDGILFLEKADGFDFSWDFYNADGSSAEMCGNAARCAALYFRKNIHAKTTIRFKTLAGEIEADILGEERVRVLMPRLANSYEKIEDQFHINTGVPHFVVQENPTTSAALLLRPIPGPKGSNVTFVYKVDHGSCEAITYERGVEGFTQSCGTGAVAAAAYLSRDGLTKRQSIHMPGGTLTIEGAFPGERPTLEGFANKNYELVLPIKNPGSSGD